jgi:hypothetical protein
MLGVVLLAVVSALRKKRLSYSLESATIGAFLSLIFAGIAVHRIAGPSPAAESTSNSVVAADSTVSLPKQSLPPNQRESERSPAPRDSLSPLIQETDPSRPAPEAGASQPAAQYPVVGAGHVTEDKPSGVRVRISPPPPLDVEVSGPPGTSAIVEEVLQNRLRSHELRGLVVVVEVDVRDLPPLLGQVPNASASLRWTVFDADRNTLRARGATADVRGSGLEPAIARDAALRRASEEASSTIASAF